jgi:tRNA G10  N-methylase Trm11
VTDPRSLSYDQHEILQNIRALHCPDGFEVDASYGNGAFYREAGDRPIYCFDADESLPNCVVARSEALPLPDSSVGSVVFDPPFLTYIRQNREGNGKMVMARRFAGYWRYDELETHYRASLREFQRILRKKGICVFKCQDIIHNHRMHATHINVVQWAAEYGFRLKDLFILGAKNRMPRPNRKGPPQHARIFHSYFLVFEKVA